MRKNLIRRIACLASVVLILCACAVPVFALGEDYGASRYASIPFDYLTVSGYGGPIDYFGRYSKVGTDLDTTIMGFPDDLFFTNYTTCDTRQIYTSYDFSFIPAAGATSTTSVSFTLNDSFIKPLDNGTIFRIGAISDSVNEEQTTSYTVTSVYVGGYYYTAGMATDGSPSFFMNNFGETVAITYADYQAIDIADLIRTVIPSKDFNADGMYFGELNIQFRVRRDYGFNGLRVTCTSNQYGTYTTPMSFSGWASEQLRTLSYPEDTSNFNVGTFLGNSVSTFMTTPIWGEFTIGHLLGISLTLGLLFYVLKMLV